MVDTFRKLHNLLTVRERRNALLLFAMVLVMGFLDAVGVASVMPFIAAIGNRGFIQRNAYLAAAYDTLGFADTDAFLLLLGTGVFCLVLGSLAFKALTEWATNRFIYMRGYTLSVRLVQRYLNRPYSFFLNRHSAELGNSVLAEVQQVVNGSLLPAVQCVANIVVAGFLFTLLAVASTTPALIAMGVLTGAYAILYGAVRKILARIGLERVEANVQRFRIAQEAFTGIKAVKVLNLEDNYIRHYQKPAYRFARTMALARVINVLPQFLFQGLAFGSLVLLLLILVSIRDGDLVAVLPEIALYAFAGMRLLPALQGVYQSIGEIRFSGPALDSLHSELVDHSADDAGDEPGNDDADRPPIRLTEMLMMDRISYTYPAAERTALRDLTLKIKAKTTVGIVGTTGAGKTTIVDVLLGLLEPQNGAMLVDGERITRSNIRRWQRSIGYVPQSIFLSDDTIASNIAFGLPASQIDQQAVERAARIAEIHDFVITEMPDGYATLVGEGGIRLSGGQRQRIGIARALYHDSDILILDEATNALDTVTEKAIMDAIHNMGHKKTIILIAHRLSTVQACDTVVMLEQGRILASGTYAELLATCEAFRAMAQVSVQEGENAASTLQV